MAQLPISNRRSIAPQPPPPPEPAQDQTLFDYIMACVTAINPAFPQQGQNESDNDYLGRICSFFSPNGEMTEEAWNQMDLEAQQWYNNASLEFEQNQPITPPDGFYEPPQEEQQPQQQVQPQQSNTPQKGQVPPGLARHQAEMRAKREAAAAAANGQGNGQYQPQPQQQPARGSVPQRMAPQQPPQQQPPANNRRQAPPAPQQQQYAAPAVPQRRAQQQPVYTPPTPVQPQRRQAPAPQQAPAATQPRQTRDQNVIDDLRAQVVYDPSMTPDRLVAYARSKGYPQAETSVRAVVSGVRSIMSLLDRMGYLNIPQG